MAKSYIKLWDSYESYFEPFGAAEVGRLVLAMMKYKSSGVEPEFSGSEKFIWPAIKRDLDEDIAFTERQSEQEKASKSKHRQVMASDGKCRQVMASDGKCRQVMASDGKSIRSRNKDVGLRTKEVGSRSNTAATPPTSRDELVSRFGEPLADAISDWIAYKAEKRDAYKPTGLKSLLTQIENQVTAHGEQAVIDVIRLSMSNGWRGIIWDRIGGTARGTNDVQRNYEPCKLNVTRF